MTSTTVTTQTQHSSPPALGPERPVAWPKRTVLTLANGLQVVVVPNHLAPAVSQMVWYKVGAADEDDGLHQPLPIPS